MSRRRTDLQSSPLVAVGRLGSRVVSVLDSGAEGPGFKSQSRRCRVSASLRSARTNRLLVPSVKLSTVGGRAFPVAEPTICNRLPDNVISAPSLSTFRQRLV